MMPWSTEKSNVSKVKQRQQVVEETPEPALCLCHPVSSRPLAETRVFLSVYVSPSQVGISFQGFSVNFLSYNLNRQFCSFSKLKKL